MKTQIIHIEPGDDIISLCDKLAWGKTGHVLLISEDEKEITLNRFSFRYIERIARNKGIQVGLVSKNKKERRVAQEAGFPVFYSIREGQGSDWKNSPGFSTNRKNKLSPDEIRARGASISDKESSWRLSTTTRISAFIVGVSSMFMLMGFLFPSATIYLQNLQKENAINLQLVVSDGPSKGFANERILLKEIQVTVEDGLIIPITTSALVADQYAIGAEDFINLTDKELYIPAGTIVASSSDPGIRFEVTRGSILPAGKNQKISLPIKALTPGTKSNLDANSIQLIIGELGFNLVANNPSPTQGGSEQDSPFPSDSDRQRITDQLEGKLKTQAIDQAKIELGDEEILFPESIRIGEILEKEFIPAEGQPGSQLSLRLKIIYILKYSSISDILSSAQPTIFKNLPEDYNIVGGSQVIESVSPLKVNGNGQMSFQVRLSQKIEKKTNYFSTALGLRGLSISSAQGYLNEQLSLTAPARLVMYPSWWPIMPFTVLQFNFVQQQ